MKDFYKSYYSSTKSKARLGEIKTAYGVIKTPGFVPVATKGTLKSLPPKYIAEIGTQVAFVNTYHLVTHPGSEIIKKAGGIHKFSKLNIPLMSDSGGFQVFSLARNNKAQYRVFSSASPPKGGSPLGFHPQRVNPKRLTQKQVSSLVNNQTRKADIRGEEEPLVIKISNDGVKFRSTFDGELIEFTPELSMKYQAEIGADINMAFDECIPYGSSYEYSKEATERTHRWLDRCIDYKKKFQTQNSKSQINPKLKTQKSKRLEPSYFENSSLFGASNLGFRTYLYGVIQGGAFEDLRKKSAEFVVSQNTDGVAIGGVSVGETKKEMREQVKWVADFLPQDRPVHLLGVGQFDDIIDLVKYGIDTFDCVEPTRLARMGQLYKISNFQFPISKQSSNFKLQISNSELDILKGIYKNNLSPVDENCNCYVCTNFTKSYLHHLFKQREILGYTLATYHNLWVMERFFEKIRDLISQNKI